jgi:4-carboxymuconolactone decarboxylase
MVVSMARIPLPTRDSLPEGLQHRWDRFASTGPVLNIYRLFLVNPEIQLNARAAWQASGLSPRAREIVILRAAFSRQSTYEWHQHVRIARDAGLSDADINAVRNWESSAGFSPDERALLAYVDAMATSQHPDAAAFDAVRQGRSDAELVGVTYLIALYFGLAQVMATMELETEEPFVGWELG